MGDLQAWIWKPRERVLVRYVSKWYDYVTMFVFALGWETLLQFQQRKTPINIKVGGFCYDMHFHY
jgi:hypothetical protein